VKALVITPQRRKYGVFIQVRRDVDNALRATSPHDQDGATLIGP